MRERTLTCLGGRSAHYGCKGGLVYAPRDIAHAFRCDGDMAVVVQLLANPSGFESFIFGVAEKLSASPPDMEKVVRVTKQYGVDILGFSPLPFLPVFSHKKSVGERNTRPGYPDSAS